MIAAGQVNSAAAAALELRIAAVVRVAWVEVPEAAAAPFKASIVAAVPRVAPARGAAPAEEALAAAGLPGAGAEVADEAEVEVDAADKQVSGVGFRGLECWKDGTLVHQDFEIRNG